MKYCKSLTILFLVALLTGACHDEIARGNSPCQNITLDKPFIAKFGETWCRPAENWEITFGPFLEDSRCNVPEYECFWQGRFVMGAQYNNGETVKDTFEVIYGSTDTLNAWPFRVIITDVYPEDRTSFEPLDTSAYSFRVVVKK